MFSYHLIQWLFLFYFYSFLGWCWETAYVSIRKHKWVNRGFLRGPFLPLYGSGAVMMLVVSRPFVGNTVLVYIAGCIGATALELVTGIVMEALFKVRYWDYSKQKFNFRGYICLGTSLGWGIFTIAMTELIHPPVERLMLSLPMWLLAPVTLVLTVFLAADFALSFKAALDLRDVLVKMEAAREEMERMQKRLDVIIAVVNDAAQARREERQEAKEERSERRAARLDELTESLNARFEQLRSLKSSLGENLEEVTELRTRFRDALEDKASSSHLKRFYNRSLLRDNPTMASDKFKDALEALKKAAEDYKNRRS